MSGVEVVDKKLRGHKDFEKSLRLYKNWYLRHGRIPIGNEALTQKGSYLSHWRINNLQGKRTKGSDYRAQSIKDIESTFSYVDEELLSFYSRTKSRYPSTEPLNDYPRYAGFYYYGRNFLRYGDLATCVKLIGNREEIDKKYRDSLRFILKLEGDMLMTEFNNRFDVDLLYENIILFVDSVHLSLSKKLAFEGWFYGNKTDVEISQNMGISKQFVNSLISQVFTHLRVRKTNFLNKVERSMPNPLIKIADSVGNDLVCRYLAEEGREGELPFLKHTWHFLQFGNYTYIMLPNERTYTTKYFEYIQPSEVEFVEYGSEIRVCPTDLELHKESGIPEAVRLYISPMESGTNTHEYDFLQVSCLETDLRLGSKTTLLYRIQDNGVYANKTVGIYNEILRGYLKYLVKEIRG